MLPTLYELAAEYKEAAEKLHDLDLPDDVIADTLEGMAGAIEQKGVSVMAVVRNCEAMAEQIKAAEAQMAMRRKAIEARADRMRDYLKSAMEATGIKKIECPWFVISLRQSQPSVVIDCESAIPDDYWREVPATRAPDKKLIAQAIKGGFDVPGCHTQRGTYLVTG